MALWGKNDSVGSSGTVSLNYASRVLTGTGTSFGIAGGCEVGQVIRIGVRDGIGTYYGDAVITSIASSESLTIASTSGLSGSGPIAGTDFSVSELPLYTVGDVTYSESSLGTEDKIVYGISTSAVAMGHSGSITHHGWVGVMTYMDMHGNLRVKTETLVAMSGITTGAGSIVYPTDV